VTSDDDSSSSSSDSDSQSEEHDDLESVSTADTVDQKSKVSCPLL